MTTVALENTELLITAGIDKHKENKRHHSKDKKKARKFSFSTATLKTCEKCMSQPLRGMLQFLIRKPAGFALSFPSQALP